MHFESFEVLQYTWRNMFPDCEKGLCSEFLWSMGWMKAALPFHLLHLLKALRQWTAIALWEKQGKDPNQHSQASHQDIW